MRNTVLFLTISGLRGTGRTKLYEELEAALPNALGIPQCDFAFLGNPFAHVKHPLLWAVEQKRRPVSLLFAGWAKLNEFTEVKLLPALQSNKKVILTDGFGLDVVLRATACIDCLQDDDTVLAMHHSLVAARIREQGISPPLYIITRTDTEQVVRYMKTALSNVDERAARMFIEKENAVIERYFAEGTGQHAIHLDASLSIAEMARRATGFIRTRLVSPLETVRLRA